jgi:hypothetical protein
MELILVSLILPYSLVIILVHIIKSKRGLFLPGVKRQGCEAYSPPTRAEVKKPWIYATFSPYLFMAYWLIN